MEIRLLVVSFGAFIGSYPPICVTTMSTSDSIVGRTEPIGATLAPVIPVVISDPLMTALVFQLEQLTTTVNELNFRMDSIHRRPNDSFTAPHPRPTTHFRHDQQQSQTVTDWMQSDHVVFRAPPWPDPDQSDGPTSYSVSDWQHQPKHAPPPVQPDPYAQPSDFNAETQSWQPVYHQP